ncbi:MAG TPA: glycosyltransferase family 4 protein [Opitutaceae bacterium]|nr:glycosyltransferase family 4 protein [Opitutaceae bacterium]
MSAAGDRPRLVFVNRVYRPSEAATAQLLADLAESLAARGWPVDVVATGDDEGLVGGVRVHRAGPTRPRRGILARAADDRAFHAAVRRRLGGVLAPGDVAVAMTDPPLLSVAVQDAAAARGARTVHWIQDIYPDIVAAHAGRWLWPALAPLRWRRNRAWRAAAACAPVSADMARHVLAQGVPAPRVSVLPNWAPRELDQPAAAAAVQAQRARWGFGDRFVVAYSGNLGRVHEFATVLAAAARLRDRTDIAFAVIGDGPRLPAVRAAAARAGLANVRFLPPQPRAGLAASLAAADAHLVTLRPAFGSLVSPSKLAGAFAAGRPVLFVGPEGSAAAAVHGGCGSAFRPGDDDGLASTIAAWAGDPAQAARLGAAARAAYERAFTLAGAVARWEALLRSVAAAT